MRPIATPAGLRDRALRENDPTTKAALYSAADQIDRYQRRFFLLHGWAQASRLEHERALEWFISKRPERFGIGISEDPDDLMASLYQRVRYRQERIAFSLHPKAPSSAIYGAAGFIAETPEQAREKRRQRLHKYRLMAHNAKHRSSYKGDPMKFSDPEEMPE